MQQYLDGLKKVLNEGYEKKDRTGVGCISLPTGLRFEFDLSEGFPIITTKRINFKAVYSELIWFLSGSTNINDLKGTRIWDEWADENGELGKIYGYQWRSWNGEIDQLKQVINDIQEDPYSRRHVVTAWNPSDKDEQNLPPCHILFQFIVNEDTYGKKVLNLQLYQRSGDMFLGVPFNISSYSLLLHFVAREVKMKPGVFVHTIGDAHIYMNHIGQVLKQLKRKPEKLPELFYRNSTSLFDLKMEHFYDTPLYVPSKTKHSVCLHEYGFAPKITAPVAV